MRQKDQNRQLSNPQDARVKANEHGLGRISLRSKPCGPRLPLYNSPRWRYGGGACSARTSEAFASTVSTDVSLTSKCGATVVRLPSRAASVYRSMLSCKNMLAGERARVVSVVVSDLYGQPTTQVKRRTILRARKRPLHQPANPLPGASAGVAVGSGRRLRPRSRVHYL